MIRRSEVRGPRSEWGQRAVRMAVAAAAVSAVGLFAFACGDDDDGDLRSVTLMLDWTPNTNHSGIYLAIANGYYEDEGLDVQVQEPAAAGAPQVVAAGGAQFGITVQESLIPARAEGIPIVSIGAILQHNDSSFMALGDDGIQGPADFAGKVYGGYGGALEQQLIEQLVTCDGGDPSAVEFVNVGDVDYLSGMEQDRFDFVWVFEGWDVVRAREIEGKDITTVKLRDHLDCIPDWYTPLFIASEELIADDPDLVRSFLAATSRGYEDAISDPEAAADALLEGAPELDRDLVERSAAYLADKYVDEGRQWGLQDLDTWETFTTFLVEAGLIDDAIDVEAAFTNEFLPSE